MIHEHDDLELASAAMDFGLTDAEVERLSMAVDDCPVCAERAMAYRGQMRLLAELPPLEPSLAVRRRVMSAATASPRFDARPPLLLLAAALLIGALLAVAAAVGSFKDPSTISELPPPDSSQPLSSANLAEASVPAESSVPAANASVAAGPRLPSSTIAVVVSDNVRVRSAPRVAADSIKYEPLLKIGDRLFVIDGPVVADDYDWYQVSAWRPRGEAFWPVGWVARADHDGTPWVEATQASCPAAPATGVLIAMNTFERLACYQDTRLSFRAYLSAGEPSEKCVNTSGGAPCASGPSWLAEPNGPVAYVDGMGRVIDGGSSIVLGFDPDVWMSRSTLPFGRMTVLEGAFDHPASRACTISQGQSIDPRLTSDDAVLGCRTRFVVTGIVPDKNYLTVNTAAITTTSGLRVRSQPLVDDTSERYQPLLPNGTRLFVLAGPALGSGYDWYQVMAPTISRSGGGPMVGWIAIADNTGETWARVLDLGCPSVSGPIALADLGRLASGAVPDGGLSCFGRKTISTTAFLRQVSCSGLQPFSSIQPDWLGSPDRPSWLLTPKASVPGATPQPSPAVSVPARIHPDLAFTMSCDSLPDVAWVVEGHFDDLDAISCDTGAADVAEIQIYRCRSIFVITKLTPA